MEETSCSDACTYKLLEGSQNWQACGAGKDSYELMRAPIMCMVWRT